MLTKTELMQPVVVEIKNGVYIYGRITKLSGSVLGGIHSIIHVTTPHGTIGKTGIAYVHDCNEEELVVLNHYEDMAGKNIAYPLNEINDVEYKIIN